MPDDLRSPPAPEADARTSADHARADIAYRRAWWSLVLYPFTFVAAFAVGEGLASWLGGGDDDPGLWVMVASATPAMVVFAIPGILAVVQGLRAMRLGRPDGNAPAIVGAAIALGFIGLNLASGLLMVLFG